MAGMDRMFFGNKDTMLKVYLKQMTQLDRLGISPLHIGSLN